MEDRQNQYEDLSRVILVVNDDADPAPPFALLEVTGYDPDRQAFLVRKPTRLSANDLLVNGPGAIDPGEEGQAHTGPWLPVAWEDDGSLQADEAEGETRPAVGSTVGSQPGSWYACPRASGYRVAALYGEDGDKVLVCRPLDYNLVQHVEITGCQEDWENYPPEFSPARIVFFDPNLNDWVYPDEDIEVWYRDESGLPTGDAQTVTDPAGGSFTLPCRVQSVLTGNGYGRPVYVGRAKDCARCTTTTTTAGCAGECVWSGGFGINWTRDSSTCAAGCYCIAPNFCPGPDNPVAVTRTACYRGLAHQTPVQCDNNTTTTGGPCNTTAGGEGCTEGCDFYCQPGRGWVEVSNGCSDSCPCPPPTGPCHGPTYCSTAHTACQLPPNPTCSGGCRYIWDTLDGGSWILLWNLCAGVNVSACLCDEPAGEGAACGSETVTPCYTPCTPPCCPPATTTTTGGPGCLGECTFKSDGFWWVVTGTCEDGCDCQYPAYTPGSEDEIAAVPCKVTTTTTTTTTAGVTTTTTTTTTTRSGIIYYCCETYFCEGVSDCDGVPDPCVFSGVGCYAYYAEDTPGGCYVFGPNNRELVTNCVEVAGCPDASCTTTGGCGGDCEWTCQSEAWVQTGVNCDLGCGCEPVPESLPCNEFNEGEVFVFGCDHTTTTTTTPGAATTPGGA